MNVNPLGEQVENSGVIYNQHTPLTPGIYQVRVAARDENSGRVGSAIDWVVIPDLTKHQLALSSLLLGGQVLESASKKDSDAQIQLSVNHSFARSSRLGYWVFAYNVKRDATGRTNLIIQSQAILDGRIVLTGQPRTIVDAGPDPDRIAFGDQLLLSSLSRGRYDLRVTVTDSLSGAKVTQTVNFDVW